MIQREPNSAECKTNRELQVAERSNRVLQIEPHGLKIYPKGDNGSQKEATGTQKGTKMSPKGTKGSRQKPPSDPSWRPVVPLRGHLAPSWSHHGTIMEPSGGQLGGNGRAI